MAFVRKIAPISSDSIHTVSPAWALTFVPYTNVIPNIKEGKATEPSGGASALDIKSATLVDNAVIVINDCAQVSISESKSGLSSQMTALLYATDVNYLEVIMPGDFVFVNIVKNEIIIEDIFNAAKNQKPLNKEGFGFKGVFRINSVRRMLTVDPASGIKRVMFQVVAFSFTELNSVVYFNPFLITQEEKKLPSFLAKLNESFIQYVSKEKAGAVPVQRLIEWLSSVFIGPNQFLKEKKVEDSPNRIFKIPVQVFKYLGLKSTTYTAKDMYRYLFGIQKYRNDSYHPSVGQEVTGWTVFQPEYWNQVTVWSILKRYENPPINELFTCFRLDNDNLIKPFIVYRQMPYTSDKFAKKNPSIPVTKFSSLPRWVIDPSLLLDINIGREDSHRINFVQVQSIDPVASSSAPQSNNFFISDQIASGNYAYDSADIVRSGLRPAILVNAFDLLSTNKKAVYAPIWSKLLSDVMIGGHLKLNGTITTIGIQEAIAVGDNLQLGDTLYHIEAINHQATISHEGHKSFITTIALSYGIKADQSKGKFDKIKERSMKDDIKKDKNLPDHVYEYIYGNNEIRSSKDKK